MIKIKPIPKEYEFHFIIWANETKRGQTKRMRKKRLKKAIIDLKKAHGKLEYTTIKCYHEPGWKNTGFEIDTVIEKIPNSVCIVGPRKGIVSDMIEFGYRVCDRIKNAGKTLLVASESKLDRELIKYCDANDIPVIVHGLDDNFAIRTRSKVGRNRMYRGKSRQRKDRHMIQVAERLIVIHRPFPEINSRTLNWSTHTMNMARWGRATECIVSEFVSKEADKEKLEDIPILMPKNEIPEHRTIQEIWDQEGEEGIKKRMIGWQNRGRTESTRVIWPDNKRPIGMVDRHMFMKILQMKYGKSDGNDYTINECLDSYDYEFPMSPRRARALMRKVDERLETPLARYNQKIDLSVESLAFNRLAAKKDR